MWSGSGTALAFRGERPLAEHSVVEPPSVGDALGRVEDLKRDEDSFVVVVEDDAWLLLVAFGNIRVLSEDEGQGVVRTIVASDHGSVLQSFLIFFKA